MASLAAKFNLVRADVSRNGGVINDEHLQEAADIVTTDEETVSLLVLSTPSFAVDMDDSHSPRRALLQQLQAGDLEEDIEAVQVTNNTASTSIEAVAEAINRTMSAPIREILRHLLPRLQSESIVPLSHSVNNSNNSNNPSGDHHSGAVPLWRAILCLVASIFAISLLASTIVAVSESFIVSLHLDSSTVGATLVAFGSEVSLQLVVYHLLYLTTSFPFTNRFLIP